MQHVGRRFSRPMVGDADGLFMANYEVAARHLAERLSCHLVVELCCGIGATTMCLARTCRKVYAVEHDPARIEYARANAETWGVCDRVEFVCGDALDEGLLRGLPHPQAVFADPEWEPLGQPLAAHARDPGQTQPPTPELMARVRRYLTENIALRMPLAADLQGVRALGPCEVEQVYIDGQPKFYYVYYGALTGCAGPTEVRLRNPRSKARHPGFSPGC